MAINEELKKRLALIEEEQQRQEKDVSALSEREQMIPPVKKKTVPDKVGYCIRLIFSASAPISEWSDETHGWRTAGLGSRYSSQALAEQRLAELKKRWPTYPLEVSFTKK